MKRMATITGITLFAAALLALAPSIAAAEIVSVTVQRSNVRSGPGGDVLWEAYRHTPFKVTMRQGSWVEIEDFEGDSGWVHKSVLGKSPAVIVKTIKANLRSGAGGGSEVLWVLEQGYPLKVLKKQGSWYNVTDGDEVTGWLHASTVWGFSEEDDGDDAPAEEAAPEKGFRNTQVISDDSPEEEAPAGDEAGKDAQEDGKRSDDEQGGDEPAEDGGED